MHKRTYIVIATLVVLVSLLWMILTPVYFPGVQAESAQAAHKGFQAPDFTLQTPGGQNVTLSDYRGKPVLVFLWASWCTVCKATMPDLEPVYQSYAPQGFEILAVNTTAQDVATSAVTYFQEQNYSFPMLLDPEGAVSRQYGMRAVPTSVLIGPDGVVQDVVIGAGMSAGELQAWLDDVLVSGEGE